MFPSACKKIACYKLLCIFICTTNQRGIRVVDDRRLRGSEARESKDHKKNNNYKTQRSPKEGIAWSVGFVRTATDSNAFCACAKTTDRFAAHVDARARHSARVRAAHLLQRAARQPQLALKQTRLVQAAHKVRLFGAALCRRRRVSGRRIRRVAAKRACKSSQRPFSRHRAATRRHQATAVKTSPSWRAITPRRSNASQ